MRLNPFRWARDYALTKDDTALETIDGHAPSPSPSADSGSYKTYAGSDNGSYVEYEETHNPNAGRMRQIIRQVKILKAVAVLQMLLIVAILPGLILKCPLPSMADNTTLTRVTTNSILAINTRQADKQAFFINPIGSYTQVDFQFGPATQVWNSCSIQWQNRMVVFGGFNERKQISEVKDCGLTRIGSLAFNFHSGACANMQNVAIFLCFDWWDGKGKVCRSSSDPLGKFNAIDDSNFNHYLTRIASDNDKFLALGSSNARIRQVEDDKHNHSHCDSELYSRKQALWTICEDYPFKQVVIEFTMVARNGNFIVFGGVYAVNQGQGWDENDIIAQFNPDSNKWTKLGHLQNARHQFGVIEVGNIYIVIGGQDEKKTETCQLINSTVSCVEREPTLEEFREYPELFLVDSTFADLC